MNNVAEQTWIEACAHGLQKHWTTADPLQLEEVARELWENDELKPMAPSEAVSLWLQPVRSSRDREVAG